MDATRISQRNGEGDNLMKEGDKLITKTVFRWKPDWDTAGPIFDRAGNAYKNAQNHYGAREAFKKAAKCFLQSDLEFLGAKNLESASMMSKEMKDDDEAIKLIEESVTHYRVTGNADKAAELLIKAARWVEGDDAEKAIEFCKTAIEVYEVDEKEHFSGNAYKYAIGLCLKNGRIEQALKFISKQADIHGKLNHESDEFKSWLSILIIHLSRDDYAAAEKSFQDYVCTAGFATSAEGRSAAEILDAFEKRNQEALKKALSKQVFTFLDNEVAKLAKKLTVTGVPASPSTNQKDEDLNSLA